MKTKRNQFTDREWALFKAGKCCWQTAYGLPWMRWCGKKSMRGHPYGYCRADACEAADLYGVRP